jgi:hypothetical protein
VSDNLTLTLEFSGVMGNSREYITGKIVLFRAKVTKGQKLGVKGQSLYWYTKIIFKKLG